MAKKINPRRGEIWWVNFDPRVGDEIRKTRPAVVINPDSLGVLQLRIVIPITSWTQKFEHAPWIVKLPANSRTGLDRAGGADTFQVKSLSVERFTQKKGVVSAEELETLTAGVAMCIGYC